MKRCKHLNCTLVEEYITSSVHWFSNGELTGHLNDDSEGEYTSKFWIECKDCGKTFAYSGQEAAPKWAKRLYDLATSAQSEFD